MFLVKKKTKTYPKYGGTEYLLMCFLSTRTGAINSDTFLVKINQNNGSNMLDMFFKYLSLWKD